MFNINLVNFGILCTCPDLGRTGFVLINLCTGAGIDLLEHRSTGLSVTNAETGESPTNEEIAKQGLLFATNLMVSTLMKN